MIVVAAERVAILFALGNRLFLQLPSGRLQLRGRGIPIHMEFVGPAYPPALRRLEQVMQRVDPEGRFLHYRGPVPYDELHTLRDEFDVFVFASSCENMPITLLEGMAEGFPIACARRGPMPEMLGDAGVYFDPEDPASIASALEALVSDDTARARYAAEAYARAEVFSWERCARETFGFLARVARRHGRAPDQAGASSSGPQSTSSE